jgi:benzil reductase ((S)-benzoin forming)
MATSLLIITGHSQGLGRAILNKYLENDDFEIIAISRTSLKLDLPRLTDISLDLGMLEVLESALASIFPSGDFKRIHLINNAGWIGEIKPIGRLGVKKLKVQVNVNLLAPMYLTNAFIAAYRDATSKKIVCNISSGAASKPVEGWGGYCSTKAALAMFTQVADKESNDPAFKFYSLAPGIVDTPMQGDIRSTELADFPDQGKFLAYKNNGDLSTPEEVASKIFYLLENDAEFDDVIQDVRNFKID